MFIQDIFAFQQSVIFKSFKREMPHLTKVSYWGNQNQGNSSSLVISILPCFENSSHAQSNENIKPHREDILLVF